MATGAFPIRLRTTTLSAQFNPYPFSIDFLGRLSVPERNEYVRFLRYMYEQWTAPAAHDALAVDNFAHHVQFLAHLQTFLSTTLMVERAVRLADAESAVSAVTDAHSADDDEAPTTATTTTTAVAATAQEPRRRQGKRRCEAREATAQAAAAKRHKAAAKEARAEATARLVTRQFASTRVAQASISGRRLMRTRTAASAPLLDAMDAALSARMLVVAHERRRLATRTAVGAATLRAVAQAALPAAADASAETRRVEAEVAYDARRFVLLDGAAGGAVVVAELAMIPSCTCGEWRGARTPLCVHLLWLLLRVFKVPLGDDLLQQRAFLSTELVALQRAFDARRVAAVRTRGLAGGGGGCARQSLAARPDCPVCYERVAAADGAVCYCAACGVNVHAACVGAWRAQRGRRTQPTACPFCFMLASAHGLNGFFV